MRGRRREGDSEGEGGTEVGEGVRIQKAESQETKRRPRLRGLGKVERRRRRGQEEVKDGGKRLDVCDRLCERD